MKRDFKFTRTGSTPRVIFYSQTAKGHGYDYFGPVLEITGKSSRHITQKLPKDKKFKNKIKLFPQPNTGRTINPNLDNQDEKNKPLKTEKKNKSLKYYETMDKTFKEIIEKKQKYSVKVSKKKNVTCEDLLKNFRDVDENEKNAEITENINNINFPCDDKNFSRNCITCKEYLSYQTKKKYDFISEIVNLPGGIKREEKEIKDDYYDNNKKKNLKIINNSTASSFKHKILYSSNINNNLYNDKVKINIDLNNNDFNEYDNNRKRGKSADITRYNKDSRKKQNKDFFNVIYSSNKIFYPNNNFDEKNNNNYQRSNSSSFTLIKKPSDFNYDPNNSKNYKQTINNTKNFLSILSAPSNSTLYVDYYNNSTCENNKSNQFITNYMNDYNYNNAIINQTDSILYSVEDNFSNITSEKTLTKSNTSKNIRGLKNIKSSLNTKKKNSCYFNSTNLYKNIGKNKEQTIFKGYYGVASKEKQECQDTCFTYNHQKKKFSELQNKMFNEIHQEKPFSIKTNYSKRNYSQFALS